MARTGFRYYSNIKNFAEHRCVKVKHGFNDGSGWGMSSCPEEYWEENVQADISMWCTGKYTWHGNFIYFEKRIDATMFSLKYPVNS